MVFNVWLDVTFLSMLFNPFGLSFLLHQPHMDSKLLCFIVLCTEAFLRNVAGTKVAECCGMPQE